MKPDLQNSSPIRKINAGKAVAYCWMALIFHLPAFSLAITSPDMSATEEGIPFYSCFNSAADQHGIDRHWLIAVAIIESSLDPTAVSTANAMGIMQIKWPQTAKHLGIDDQRILFDACSSIEAGARYLAEVRTPYLQLLPEQRDNMMLAAYRIGPNALKRLNQLPEVAEEYIRKVRFEKSNLDQIVEAAQHTCVLEDLKRLALKTHHPLARGQRSIDWITQNQSKCDQTSWKRLIENLPIWLGTAHSNVKLQELLAKLFNN